MIVRPIWLRLSAAAALLMAVSSAAGILVPGVYARETPSWAAQGIGQDVVNLFIVLPALLVCVYLTARGSLRASLVWAGLLLYVTYSYVLYAFFVHFNRVFLAYVMVLGLSFWALAGAAANVNVDRLARAFDIQRRFVAHAVFLAASGVLFAAWWLGEIVPATVSGAAPRGLTDVGLPVNPVHVLDLAFALPAMILASWLVWKRRPLSTEPGHPSKRASPRPSSCARPANAPNATPSSSTRSSTSTR